MPINWKGGADPTPKAMKEAGFSLAVGQELSPKIHKELAKAFAKIDPGHWAVKKVVTTQFVKQAEDWYMEDRWVSERLFDVEKFFPPKIVDPFCGSGRILDAAKLAGYKTFGLDVVNRSHAHNFELGDVFKMDFPASQPRKGWSFVSNPPYDRVDELFDEMIKLGVSSKTVMFLPMAYLAGKAKRLKQLPLVRVWICKPRPNCLPGELIQSGVKPSGGKKDYAWFVFEESLAIDHTLNHDPKVLFLDKDPAQQMDYGQPNGEF